MKSDGVKLFLLSGFGSGLIPLAPGTWSSALAAGLWLAAAMALHASHPLLLQFATVGGVLLAGAACVALSPWIIHRTGRDDPSQVTADEFAGQWLAMLWVQPFVGSLALTAAVQFVLFRVFDIAKPSPCNRLEKLPKGWGILADDLMAGFYANLAGKALNVAIAYSMLPQAAG